MQVVLIFFTILLAFLTVELRDLLKASICLCGTCVTIAASFWLLSAPYVSVFQLLIYSGAVNVLFVVTVMLTKREEEKEE